MRYGHNEINLELAKKSCKSCYGTGRLGRRITGKHKGILVCPCVVRASVDAENKAKQAVKHEIGIIRRTSA